ncbi:Thioredoxin F-type, chloroplastic [Galdieria sulphuraria]|uniref:Thioredoxin f n=1 Tax=Galdieria sulphuraria TaxID=130081 RepID=M2VXS5_GALSU|nr:thioredoxin f [Galdieria sulphuraria]EME28091.1 thioredoxin f [Galdieria sulphuraria]GJD12128.1 Thioredoxin F-type, chloroplastic [Galdieria sulphuraria]|eukprot:XP_005704611.1 thioredoxin f [Galdieria sulphuraria]
MSSQNKVIECFVAQPLSHTVQKVHGVVVSQLFTSTTSTPFCSRCSHRGVNLASQSNVSHKLFRSRVSTRHIKIYLQSRQYRVNSPLKVKATVTEIDSQDQLDQELEKAGSKLTIVDFSTTWCGPCKVVAPKFEELSEKYQQVLFLKVVGDKSGETNKIMKSFGIRAVPTFKFIKGKKSIYEVAGARIDALEDGIKSYM